MSDVFLAVKWLHIVSATVLFGTGLGTALHMWLSHLSRDTQAIAVAARNTVRVDWLFTATSGVVQPVTGVILIYLAGHDPWASWLAASYALYGVAAVCWIPVVWLQTRVRDLAAHAAVSGEPLPPAYNRYMRLWVALGWPAFVSLLAAMALMVAKPVL